MKPRRAATHPDALRAFLALELDADARARVAASMEALRPGLGGIRPVAADNLHLTLRFLGQAAPAQLERFWHRVSAEATRCRAARVPLGGLGVFPQRGAPRILWLAVELPADLLELQAASERAAVDAGFPPEARPFRPHLTLGRWRAPAPRPLLAAPECGEASLSRLVLFRSELRSQGPLYTALREHALPLPAGMASGG